MRRTRLKKKHTPIDKSQLMFGIEQRIEDDPYSEYVKTQPCIITGHRATEWMAVDPAHVRYGADGGGALKPSGRFINPIRHDLHVLQHTIGEPTFWGRVFTGQIPDAIYWEKLLMEAVRALAEKRYEEWKNEQVATD